MWLERKEDPGMFEDVDARELTLETLFEELAVCVSGTFEWHVVMYDILDILFRDPTLLDRYIDRI
jgi:hypothetical protein